MSERAICSLQGLHDPGEPRIHRQLDRHPQEARIMSLADAYPLVVEHSYGKSQFIVKIPIKNCNFAKLCLVTRG